MFYGKDIWSPKHHGNRKQHFPVMETPYQTIRSDIKFLEICNNRNELPQGQHVDHLQITWWYLFEPKPYSLGYNYGWDFNIVRARTWNHPTSSLYNLWMIQSITMPAYRTSSPLSSLLQCAALLWEETTRNIWRKKNIEIGETCLVQVLCKGTQLWHKFLCARGRCGDVEVGTHFLFLFLPGSAQ